MIKTQVYLEDHQPQSIELLAKVRNKKEAAIIREALEIGLRQMQEENSGNANVFLGLIELGKKMKISAPSDFSMKIDDYLYGDKE